MPGAPEAPSFFSSTAGGTASGDTGGSGVIENPISQKEQIVENGRLVRAAAEAFAAINDGWYPANLLDENGDGVTLVDLLPGGQPLVNPVTGARNLPIDGAATGSGETGYLALVVDDRIPKGYWIKGNGRSGAKIADIKRSIDGAVTESTGKLVPTLDDLVLKNCLIVAAASEAYAAENGGVYTDRVTDLKAFLPYSLFLINPSTGADTEPVQREPGGPGSTSYNTLQEYDEYWNVITSGHRIAGRGEHGDFVLSNAPDVINKEKAVIRNCLVVRDAAEAWAVSNEGVYSNGLADTNPWGATLVDFLPGGRLLINPFTSNPTEPIAGGAPYIGSTGYIGMDQNGNGSMDCYVIDGAGASDHEIIYQKTCWE